MMSATSLVLVLLAVFLASLCANALIVWGAGKLLRAPTVTFPRALALVVLNSTVGALASWWSCLSPLTLFGNPLFDALLALLLGLLVQIFLIRIVLRISLGKVLALAGIWFLVGAVYGTGLFFLLRFAVAEGFVVPTGGMATAVLGYHKDVFCPKCGFEFPVNCSQEVDAQEGDSVVVTGCTCPNCRFPVELAREEKGTERDPRTGQRMERTVWVPVAKPITADRILAGKSFLGLTGVTPDHLDLVVFDYPAHVGEKGERIKYVKRVVGLPGETVAISYGKLYVLAPDKGLRFDDGGVPELDRWQYEHMHVDDPRAAERWDKKEFQPLRKPPEVVLAMRRIVYDNDHPAQDLKDFPRWSGNKAWAEEGSAHTFKRAAANDAGLAWLRYRHVIARGGRTRPELITDFMGYNSYEPQPAQQTQRWVGDLMLDCEVTIDKPEGQVVLELSRGADRFRAAFDLATGDCTLKQVRNKDGKGAPADDAGEELAKKPTALKKAGTYHVRFANVDDRLLLWVDHDLPFGKDGQGYTLAEDHGPYPPNDLEPASIGVKGAGVTVGKLQLWRDTYYTQMQSGGRDDYPAVDLSNPEDWGALHALKPMTMYVQPGHYLCLGDNSPYSSDSRVWGLVPERLLCGRAVLTYYPFTRLGPLH